MNNERKRIRYGGNDTTMTYSRGRRDYREHCDITGLVANGTSKSNAQSTRCAGDFVGFEHPEQDTPDAMDKADKVIICACVGVFVVLISLIQFGVI